LPAPDPKPESTEDATLRSAAGLLALRELPGVGPKTTLRLALLVAEFDPHLDGHARLWQEALPKAQAEVKRCRAAGIAVVSIFEDAYPQRLRTIAEPPPVLFVKGAL
jgi:DNA processing protein